MSSEKNKLKKLIQRVDEAIGDLGPSTSDITSRATAAVGKKTSLLDLLMKALGGEPTTGGEKTQPTTRVRKPRKTQYLGKDLPDVRTAREKALAAEEEVLGTDFDIEVEEEEEEDIEQLDIDSDVEDRVSYISNATGVKPEAIYAIEKTESTGRPDAFAFNAQIYRRHSGDKQFHPRKRDVYKSEAKRLFDEAYEKDPIAAIKGGAWGFYQVLGETSFSIYGTPERFVAAFDANPMEHSVRSLTTWLNNAGGSFKQAINDDDYRTWVKMYYGPKAFTAHYKGGEYVKRYKRHRDDWLRGRIA